MELWSKTRNNGRTMKVARDGQSLTAKVLRLRLLPRDNQEVVQHVYSSLNHRTVVEPFDRNAQTIYRGGAQEQGCIAAVSRMHTHASWFDEDILPTVDPALLAAIEDGFPHSLLTATA